MDRLLASGVAIGLLLVALGLFVAACDEPAKLTGPSEYNRFIRYYYDERHDVGCYVLVEPQPGGSVASVIGRELDCFRGLAGGPESALWSK